MNIDLKDNRACFQERVPVRKVKNQGESKGNVSVDNKALVRVDQERGGSGRNQTWFRRKEGNGPRNIS